MKKQILSLLLLLSAYYSFGQTYGNEWINYSQSYYRFEIAKTGIYRMDYNTLANAGIPLSTFNTKNIQVFGRQKEIPIYVVDGGDQSFDPGDYFLFYAEKNDGWLDSLVYEDPNGIANPTYSLYNDTINYFFTWNDQINNKRFTYQSYNTSEGPATPASFWLSKVDQAFTSFYVECKDVNGQASSSMFLPGEGWSNGHVNGINGYTFPINCPTTSPYTLPDAPAVKFQGISVSNSNAYNNTGAGYNHDMSWKVGPNDLLLYTNQFEGYQQQNVNTAFPANLLSNYTSLKWIINPSADYATDFQALSYWSMIYPKLTTLDGTNRGHFWVKNHNSGKIRLDITNSTLVNPYMMVFGDVPKLVALTNTGGGIWQAIFTNGGIGIDQEVVLQDESTVLAVDTVISVSASAKFKNFSVYGSDTNVVLMVYHPSMQAATGQYASYRSTAAGGSYNVVLADVNELYWQYGGGIEKHALGIRRFVHEFYNNAMIQKPKALFLMGKGIREANESFQGIIPGTRKSTVSFNNSLIPSFGYPSSDIMLTAGLDTSLTAWEPLIPTGRIAAKNNTELQEYLEKVKQHDANQDPQSDYNAANKEWQKQVLHFAGGSTAADQQQFQMYLNGMKDTIESAYFGGNVTTYMKTNSDPLDPNLIADVNEKLVDGVSIMNFFGHASVDGFEINVDNPANWNNEGKYPLVIGNACYTGDIFQNYLTASEKFVLIPDEGAIAFLSTVRLGYGFALNEYTKRLYTEISKLNYGGTISSQMKETIKKTFNETGNSIYMEIACTQMILHGDPLLKLNWHAKPEIDITEQSLFFKPDNIDLTTDSIEVNIVLTNLGYSIEETFTLNVKRTFPNNTDSSYQFLIPGLDYKDTFSFKVPLQANIGIGINYFSVDVDIPSLVSEFEDIMNNRIEKKPLIIDIDGIIPVVPYDFAVVPRDSVTVKGSTINPIADFNTYRFEIDTTDLFNSPQKRYALVSGLGGVKEVFPSQWKSATSNQPFPLVCTDSTVYFWRCAVDSSVLDWRESSFQYIQGKTGWGQDHFFQFKKNGFNGVEYDRPDRKRHFEPVTKIITADVLSSPVVSVALNNMWKINGQIDLGEGGYISTLPTFYVGVIDRVTFQAWGTRYGGANPNHAFGNFNDNIYRVMRFFTFFQNDAGSMAAMQNMLENEVPDSNYILIYTPVAARYDLWTPNMYTMFDGLGSDSIHPARPNRPMAFFCQKGDTNSVVEVFGQNPGDNIHLEAVIHGIDYLGVETSTLIGPAAEWGTVYWKQDPEEATPGDSTLLRIKAYDLAGNFQTNIDTLFTLNDSILNLNAMLSAAQYPYLKLEAVYTDTMTKTPAQMDRWHVLYQPLPEAAIDGSNQYTFFPLDTLTEGQMVTFAVDIKNIYDYDMDSLLVRYWTNDEHNVITEIPYPRQDSLRVGQVLRDTITFSTNGLGGVSSLWVEVNPYVNGSSYLTDQPEQQHFNNLLQIPFYVKRDDVNPILDVTFNGRHILNGDIIAPQSEILITLKDDNPYLLMDDVSDTTLFGIYLTDPDGVQTRIPFASAQGNSVLQWIPAENTHKRFKIIYSALFEKDGKYTLMVQGSDRSGNLSGDLEYRITFEVIHESSITYLMNYPNPFSTSTRFVFTLTGNDVPEDVIIQIMTVSGKVVREITEDELGAVHIGQNVTEYAWDGKDEFGDQLANGVYLYTVKAKINGEDIKHRESGADSYFKKNFGKMYLLR